MMASPRECFVCKKPLSEGDHGINREVHLAVCGNCQGSDEEKAKVAELLDSLAEGLVCGCI
jgi:hypothetical protein